MIQDDASHGQGAPRWPQWLLVGGAAVWAVAEALRGVAGRVPPTPELGSWIAAHLGLLQGANELTMLAIVLVVASGVGLVSRRQTPVGCSAALSWTGGTLAVASMLLLVLAEGRLAYPIPGLTLASDALTLVASVVLAARHMAALGWALALGAFTVALRCARSATWGVAGVVTVVCQLMASFPWTSAPWTPTVAALVLVGWLVAAVRPQDGS